MVNFFKMISVLVFDLSRVLLFPKDKNYKGGLNDLHDGLSKKKDYHILDHFEFNEELIAYLDSIKNRIALYVFTTGIIQNSPEMRERLKQTFKKIFSAEEIGLSKKDPKSFLYIAKVIGKKPEEILYIDDSFDGVKVAKRANYNAEQYHKLQKTMDNLQEFLHTSG